MRLPSPVIAVLVAVSLFAFVWACDDHPTAPNPSNSPNPPAPAAPTITRVTLSGPGSVAINEPSQFTAVVQMSDGTTRDVTTDSQTVWRSLNGSILSVSSTGMATGRGSGEASITVSYQNRTAFKTDIIVVPAGTYRVTGVVSDEGVGVDGARVVAWPTQSAETTTTSGGVYRLYGLSGDTEIRVIRAGYLEQKKRVVVDAHQSINFSLSVDGARELVAGIYKMTLTAAPSCSQLPAEARTKTYTAVITQTGPLATATLEGSTFYVSGSRKYNTFKGNVEPGRLTFGLPLSYYYFFYSDWPDVLDRITSSTYFSFYGDIVTTAMPSGYVGALNGNIATFGTNLRLAQSCYSASHQIEFLR